MDPAQRYTIDEFLAHPWCTAAPAPPPPPTPYAYGPGRGLDSPLLNAAQGRRVEGRSPGLATLKEAFDITYAVHRMEEEGARRRAYNGRGGAGERGFLSGLNEDDEDDDEEEVEEARRKHGDAAGRAVAQVANTNTAAGPAAPQKSTVRQVYEGGRAGQRDRGSRKGPAATGSRGFELDMDAATLLGRRHRRAVEPSPLAGKPMNRQELDDRLPPGSPMRL